MDKDIRHTWRILSASNFEGVSDTEFLDFIRRVPQILRERTFSRFRAKGYDTKDLVELEGTVCHKEDCPFFRNCANSYTANFEMRNRRWVLDDLVENPLLHIAGSTPDVIVSKSDGKLFCRQKVLSLTGSLHVKSIQSKSQKNFWVEREVAPGSSAMHETPII